MIILEVADDYSRLCTMLGHTPVQGIVKADSGEVQLRPLQVTWVANRRPAHGRDISKPFSGTRYRYDLVVM